jgi:hypothetical protein
LSLNSPATATGLGFQNSKLASTLKKDALNFQKDKSQSPGIERRVAHSRGYNMRKNIDRENHHFELTL